MVLGRPRPTTSGERIVTVLDIGTSKIVCLMAAIDLSRRRDLKVGSELPARVIGAGITRSSGVRGGSVVDLEDAEGAVRAAVNEAELQASLTVEEIVSVLGGGRIQSTNMTASGSCPEGAVGEPDIERILKASEVYLERDGRLSLHVHRLYHYLDGSEALRNPIGMPGSTLKIDLNGVTADQQAMANVGQICDRCRLRLGAVIAAPYASALGVLTEEEAKLGTTVLDFGGGTTSFAMFADGLFLHAGSLAVGGDQITARIARALSAPLNQAERIKALYGNLSGASSDELELITFSRLGGDGQSEDRVNRAQLRQIMLPQIGEIVRLLGERLEQSGVRGQAGRRLVLTGGASQLAGLSELIARSHRCQVRGQATSALAGLPEETGAGLSAAAGAIAAIATPGALPRRAAAEAGGPQGYLGRLGSWFKESFWDESPKSGTLS
jgi:cell division protein FtsA